MNSRQFLVLALLAMLITIPACGSGSSGSPAAPPQGWTPEQDSEKK